MSKIIKNTTGSDIEVVETGSTVPASGQITIDPINYGYWSTPETITEITSDVTSGNLVINNGSVDLNVADGLRYLSYPDRSTIQLGATDIVRVAKTVNFEGDVTILQSASGEATVTIGESGTAIGKLLEFEFSGTGLANNKWMNVGHPSASSDVVPFPCEWAGKIIGLSFSNKIDDSDIDLEFYVNGILKYTWEVREKRTSWKVLGSGFFTTNQGDRISVFARSIVDGVTPRDISGEVVALVNTMPDGEGGTQFGV